MPSRRTFVAILPAAAGLLAVRTARAQGVVDEKDPQAMSLGFVTDTHQADAQKYPKHADEQMCSGCQLYTAGPNAPTGPCALFQGKTVPGKGWCASWVKKAA